jgi:hypothetical protein
MSWQCCAAYDFSNTNPDILDVSIWYNDTYANGTEGAPSYLVRVSRSLNMVSLFLHLANTERGFWVSGSCVLALEFLSECVIWCFQASQAFLRYKMGVATELPLLFVKEMPKEDSRLRLDFASLLGPLFYMWILGFMFPVSTYIVVWIFSLVSLSEAPEMH